MYKRANISPLKYLDHEEVKDGFKLRFKRDLFKELEYGFAATHFIYCLWRCGRGQYPTGVQMLEPPIDDPRTSLRDMPPGVCVEFRDEPFQELLKT